MRKNLIAQPAILRAEVVIIHALHGENIGDGYGWVGAALGDLDGDGVDDFATTAPFYGGDSANGKIYRYSGKSGALLHEATGVEGNRLGYSISTAGDFDQDGTPDYLVGGSGPANRIVVYSGADHMVLHEQTSPAGVRENFGVSVAGGGDSNGDGQVDLLSGSDGAILWAQVGETPQGMLGSGLGLVGDVNDDGVPDYVTAAPGAGDNGLGEAYLLSGVDGAVLFTLKPAAEASSGGTFGTFFASGAGDVNADGTPDIFVGDYATVRGEAANTGRAYIYSGVNGALLRTFEAEADGDGLGPGRGIPDINGDGHADLSLAAWQSSEATPKGSKVYIHSGKNGSVLHTITGTIEQDALGVDALGVGDLNGDGTLDYMLTAVGNDFNGTDVGHIYIVALQTKAPALTIQPALVGCQPIQAQ